MDLLTLNNQEDDYGECDVSLQGYKNQFDSLNVSFSSANDLLSEVLKTFQIQPNQAAIDREEKGVHSFQVGNERTLQLRIREDVQMVQISTVIHYETKNDRPSCTPRGRQFMAMMRLNSILARNEFGGRICYCSGRYIFIQDFPLACMVNGNGMLKQKLENIILQSVQLARSFPKPIHSF